MKRQGGRGASQTGPAGAADRTLVADALERTSRLPESRRLEALGVKKATYDRWKRGTVHSLQASTKAKLEALLSASDVEAYLGEVELQQARRIIMSAGPARTDREAELLRQIIRAARAALPPESEAV